MKNLFLALIAVVLVACGGSQNNPTPTPIISMTPAGFESLVVGYEWADTFAVYQAGGFLGTEVYSPFAWDGVTPNLKYEFQDSYFFYDSVKMAGHSLIIGQEVRPANYWQDLKPFAKRNWEAVDVSGELWVNVDGNPYWRVDSMGVDWFVTTRLYGGVPTTHPAFSFQKFYKQ